MDKRPIMNKWYTRFLSVALILAVVCGMSWPGKIMVADAEEGGTTVVTAGDIVSGEVTPGNAADGGSVVDTGADGDTNEAEASLAEQYLGEIAALMAEAQLIDGTSADVTLKCADVYERLMEVYAEAVEAKDAGEITAEEYEEIYSTTGEVIGYLYSAYGYDPYAVALLPDDSNELAVGYYNGDCDVFWDTMEKSGSEYTSASNGTKPDMTVTLNSKAVDYANSKGTWETSAYQLKKYYPNATKTQTQTVTLSITPPTGYYVSKVVIGCTSKGNESPYNCKTWGEGNAYDEDFSFSGTSAFTVDISSLEFSHKSSSQGTNEYFILIELAPIPTPLYVEYSYGNIAEFMDETEIAGSVFADPSAWTDNYSGNVYGEGAEQTANTQFKYAYTVGKPEEAALWTHKANTVTTSAKQRAAEAGYYFAGWDAVYYKECTESNVKDSVGNDHTYSFKDKFTTASYSEGDDVRLTVHVKLTAVWKPVKLNVTKTVIGLAGTVFASNENTYTIRVEKLTDRTNDTWTQQGAELTFKLTGDGTSEVQNFSPVTPGIYRVVETDNGGDLKDTSTGTIMYLSVSDDGEVTVDADHIADGTKEYSLNVTNSYSESIPGLKLVKKWKNAEGVEIPANTSGLPTVTFTVMNGNSSIGTYQLSSDNYIENENAWVKYVKLDSQYAGVELTVTESLSDNSYEIVGGVVKGESTVEYEINGTNCVCTVYTATNKRATTDVTISKEINGNMGDLNKTFKFTATLKDESGSEVSFPASTENKYTVDGNIATFWLSDGGSVTLEDLPIGYNLTVMEENGFYTVSVTQGKYDKDNGITIAVTEGLKIDFTNTYNITIDTGILLDSLPYVLILVIVIAGVVVMFIRKRRSYDED